MSYYRNICKRLRGIYFRYKNRDVWEMPISPTEVACTPEDASSMIYKLLSSEKPCMIARYGTVELRGVLNARSVNKRFHNPIDFITGKEYEWWWVERYMYSLSNNAGFFPTDPANVTRYMHRMLDDTQQLDLLGSFARQEEYIAKELIGVPRVHLKDLEPYYANPAWTRVLKGKKVLIVHPLADLIKKQYEKRTLLFENEDYLPEFQIEVIPAVQSLGGQNEKFSNWFDALNWMENEIDKHDYDICLIGCGAYGFCLAAHCKRMGKKGFHIGGILQFMFGIIGNRWADPNFGVKEWGIPVGHYSKFINSNWVRPDGKDIPKNASKVEGACYW